MIGKLHSMCLYGMYVLSFCVQAEPYVCASRIITLFHDYYPQCPEVCMYELAQAELQAIDQNSSRPFLNEFVYRPFIAWDDNLPFRPFLERNLALEEWMKHAGLDKYEAYFIALAKSKRLSAAQKISDRFCQIPPIADLYAQEQSKKEELLEQLCWKAGSDDSYPLRRIFEALLYRSNVQLEKKYAHAYNPLEEALLYNDTSLVVQLLKQGVNANGTAYRTIELAKSVDIVRLLISYGADIKKQHREHDLVFGAACDEGRMGHFSFFLNGEKTRINESNQYGKKWFTGLCSGAWVNYAYCSQDSIKTVLVKAALLLHYGCRYDAVHENMLIRIIKKSLRREYQTDKQELARMKEQLQKLFARDKVQRAERMSIMTPHKNVYKALQQRAISGKYRCTSYSAY